MQSCPDTVRAGAVDIVQRWVFGPFSVAPEALTMILSLNSRNRSLPFRRNWPFARSGAIRRSHIP